MLEQAIRSSDNTACHQERVENSRAAAAEVYCPGAVSTRHGEPSTAEKHLNNASVLQDGSLQFSTQVPSSDATGRATKDASQPKGHPPTDAAIPDPARKALPKTEFGKEMDGRYKDRDLTPQQRDLLTRIADGAKNTDDPAQRERLARWMDRDVDGFERAHGANQRNADSGENGWKKDPSDVRNKAESGYDNLSPEQKSFVNSVAGDFPPNTYKQEDRDAVTRAAIDRCRKGDLGAGGAKEFAQAQKESIESALAASEINLAGSMQTAASAVDKSGHATDVAHVALRAATSGIIAENGAAGHEANVVGKVLQAIPGAENAAGTALKYAPIVGKVAPLLAGAGFAAAGAVQVAEGHVTEGANTGLKGALSVGASVVGAIACGGPETPIGIACGVGAGMYVDHAYEKIQEQGMAGFGELAREPAEVAKSLSRAYMKSLQLQGEDAAAGFPLMVP